MIDTNIMISAALFPSGQISTLLKNIIPLHEIYICTFSIDEFFAVYDRKFKDRKNSADEFLAEFSYTLIHSPLTLDKERMPYIRDENDYPILMSAIIADVDILITGDKDFFDTTWERPEILSPSGFSDKYL